jgi:hypothetical protein
MERDQRWQTDLGSGYVHRMINEEFGPHYLFEVFVCP